MIILKKFSHHLQFHNRLIYGICQTKNYLLKKINNQVQNILSHTSSQIESFNDYFHQYYLVDRSKALSKFVSIHSNGERTLKSFQIIYNFLKTSGLGFLSGDIHPISIYKLQDLLQENYVDLQDFYKQLFQRITNKCKFRLPYNGIRHPKLQDQINLKKRQIHFEQQSVKSIMYMQEKEKKQFDKQIQYSIKTIYIQKWQKKLYFIFDKQINEMYHNKSHIFNLYLKFDLNDIINVVLKEFMKHILQANKNKKNFINQKSFFLNLKSSMQLLYIYYQLIKLFKIKIKQTKQFSTQQFKYIKHNNKSKIHQFKIRHILKILSQQPFQKMDGNQQKQFLKQVQKQVFLNEKTIKEKELIKFEFDQRQFTQLVTFFIYLIKQNLTIKINQQQQQPIILSRKDISKKKIYKIFQINPKFLQQTQKLILRKTQSNVQIRNALPMISQPIPWLSQQYGSYYIKRINFIRLQRNSLQIQHALKYTQLQNFFKIISQISNVDWQINKQILQIIESLWIQGGNLCQIPSRFTQNPQVYQFNLKQNYSYLQKKMFKQKIKIQGQQYGLKCNFQINKFIAEAFLDIGKIYFPHNIDFRGRVYPIPPNFNHIGNDLARGLLKYGRGKKLGQRGLMWLKIHLANCCGKNKSSFGQRLNFVQRNKPMFKQIARDPLKNRQWMQYEDCWQALTTILQVCRAQQYKNPQQFISYSHIHSDGSCNGLQHYSALGRDYQAAFQVNLIERDRPGDIYTAVVQKIKQKLNQQIHGILKVDNVFFQKIIPYIKRKTIKQTVMTTVYGVTLIGAKEQIQRQLKQQQGLTKKQIHDASLLLAKMTFQVLENMFNNAHKIKTWLKDSAKKILKTQQPISWITPLGLPVIQQYYKASNIYTKNLLHPTKQNKIMKLDKHKQTNAFPPNYVHSLDSTHMICTADQCYKKDIHFAAVHDSFWCHACDATLMNKIIREQFYFLHEIPLIEQLANQFRSRFPLIQFSQVPHRGKFELKNVLQSLYLFS